MTTLVKVAPSERHILSSLFAGHRNLRTFIDSTLEGRCGSAVVDDLSDPQAAYVKLGSFTFLGGDSRHPIARQLVQQLPTYCFLIGCEHWREIIFGVHKTGIETSMRFPYSCERVDIRHIQNLIVQSPAGFHIERIDQELGDQMIEEVNPNLIPSYSFESSEDFFNRGIGFCALSGHRVVSGATSAAAFKNSIEIQVNTNEEYQRKGLATAVSAALIEFCLEHGISPNWDAHNPISCGLAEKLGYLPKEPYHALYLTDEAA